MILSGSKFEGLPTRNFKDWGTIDDFGMHTRVSINVYL